MLRAEFPAVRGRNLVHSLRNGDTLGSLRQSVQTFLGRVLPRAASLPLRSRVRGSREPELALLSELISRGDTVIDVGAHRGSYTYHRPRLVGPSGHVIASEPQPPMVRNLTRASQHGVMRGLVELRVRALSDAHSSAVSSIPVEGGEQILGQAALRPIGTGAEE